MSKLRVARSLWRLTALVLFACAGLAAACTAGAQVLARLPALALQRDAVTVSGLSSGAYMAGQFEIAYSASIAGAAVLAGGPYGCSRGSVLTAMFNCSCPAEKSFLLQLQAAFGGGCQLLNADAYRLFSDGATDGNRGAIDDIANLKTHRVWLLSGGKDKVVDAALVTAARAYYERRGVPAAHIGGAPLPQAAHGLPSVSASLPCDATRTPFLIQCQFDAAGRLLQWLYPDLQPLAPGTADTGALKPFRQGPYAAGAAFTGLDATGWVYVPKACESAAPAPCRLHVVFHGCEQGQRFVAGGKAFGLQFVHGAGYNRWAEAGRIVVLYPQVQPSSQGSLFDPYRFNPKGCWDFWGYTEKYAALNPTAPDFAKRSAPQMRAVKAMIDDLLRSP